MFALNAVLSLLSAFVILRWRHEHQPSPLGRERLISAMRVGVQFVRQSPRMRAVLTRVTIFFLHSTALLALLPLLARGLAGGDAGTFTLLLACMGAGAIVAVLVLPRLRQAHGRDDLVVARHRAAVGRDRGDGLRAQRLDRGAGDGGRGGMAWITVANSLAVSAQMSLAQLGAGARHGDATRWRSWARARSARRSGARWRRSAACRPALLSAAAGGTLFMLVAVRFVTDSADEEPDMSPARAGWAALPASAPQEGGRVVTTIEYLIDPARAAAFVLVMQETRRTRLSEGAIGWELLNDVVDPARFVEQIATNRGPSTCGASTVRPRPTSRCASGGSPSISAMSRRGSIATSFDASVACGAGSGAHHRTPLDQRRRKPVSCATYAVTLRDSTSGATCARSKLVRVPLKTQMKLLPPTTKRTTSPEVTLT